MRDSINRVQRQHASKMDRRVQQEHPQKEQQGDFATGELPQQSGEDGGAEEGTSGQKLMVRYVSKSISGPLTWGGAQ